MMLLLGVQVALVLLVFASSAHQTFRYLLPLVPYFAVSVSWSLSQINKTWLRSSVVVALGLQLVLASVGRYVSDDQLLARNRQRYVAAHDAITRATADDPPDAVWLGIGRLGVYAFDAAYHASKSEDYYHGTSPEYHSIELSLASTEIDGDIEALWIRIEASHGTDIVLMRDPPPPPNERNPHDLWQQVVQGTGEISNRVRKSPKFKRMATPDSWELEIYRYVGGP